MTRDDGGPAFPSERSFPYGGTDHLPGMTLRDYIATQAMAAMVPHVIAQKWTVRIMCQEAYSYADAMLAERVKTQQKGEA